VIARFGSTADLEPEITSWRLQSSKSSDPALNDTVRS
jgi:hypothetical protein